MAGRIAAALPGRLVAAAAIVDDLAAPTRMLAARRSAPPELAGRWELPGGKVERGESAVEALHREIAEELGVRLALGQQVRAPGDGDWPILHGLTMRVWIAVIVDGDPAPLLDHDELRWVERAGWQDLDWLEPDRPILAAILALGS